MTAFPFDPTSAGARRLARTWAPHLERWEMRVPRGHFFAEGDGIVIEAGETIDVDASAGQLLVHRGYELVSVRRLRRSG